VAVGGDGTVRLAAGLATRIALPLGIIPSGTGNGIAYSLGLPLDPWEACRVVASGRPVPCDLGLIEDISGRGNPPLQFINVCGAGLDAVIARTYRDDGLGVRGVPGYAIAAVRSLVTYHSFPVELVADGEALELEVLLVAVGNGAFYGKGIRIAPLAQPADGLLDVCVILPVGPAEFSSLVPMLLLGRHLAHPRVRTFRAREVVIRAGPEASGSVPVHADGDVVAELPVRVSVVPGGIRFVLDAACQVDPPRGRTT
jgi:diacylglycerol kinase (ATP)